MHSNGTLASGNRRRFANLAFVGRAFKVADAGQDDAEGHSRNQDSHFRGKVADKHGGAAAESSQAIKRENRAAVAETEIRKAMGGVVFARRGKRQQAAPG